MTILTSYTAACYKSQIRSSPENGFKLLYSASSTSSELFAAHAVVRKYWSEAAAQSVTQVTDPHEISRMVGDWFKSPRRKQVFTVWKFNPNATKL